MGGFKVTVDGMDYWQPDCHCEGTGHICYLRPMAQVINVPLEKILKNSGASGNNNYGYAKGITVKDSVTVSLDGMKAFCKNGCNLKYARKLIQNYVKELTGFKRYWNVWFDYDDGTDYHFTLTNPAYQLVAGLGVVGAKPSPITGEEKLHE